MGNTSSQVAVKQTRTELSIQPAPEPGTENVKNTLVMLSQLDGEISNLIFQSNIKIIPQDPNPQPIATVDQSLRGNLILKQSATAVSSADDPDISSKLLYIRKHIHRDIFTTYTSNHLIATPPPPLNEIYLANRDPAAPNDHVYYSNPPTPPKSDFASCGFNSFHASQNHQNDSSKPRYRHNSKKPSVTLSDHHLYQPQPPQDHQLIHNPTDDSQSSISIISTPVNRSDQNFQNQLTSRLALLKDSSSTSLLPPGPDHLIRRSISSLKDAAAEIISSSSTRALAANTTSLDPPYNSSYIYSPIVTQNESFHADIVSLASGQDNVVDLSNFPQLKHYAASNFHDQHLLDNSHTSLTNGTSTSSLEKHTTGFGIAFPQETSKDSITNHDQLVPPPKLNQSPITPVLSVSNLTVPNAPPQSRRKSRDITQDILPQPSNPADSTKHSLHPLSKAFNSRPISGESSEADIEIREFSSRNDTIFGESDDDATDAANNESQDPEDRQNIFTNQLINGYNGYNSLNTLHPSDSDNALPLNQRVSLNNMETPMPIRDMNTQYQNYQDNFSKDPGYLNAFNTQQIAAQQYAAQNQNDFTQQPDVQTLNQSFQPYGSFFPSRLEAIPESPALTNKMDTPVVDNDIGFNSNNDASGRQPSRLNQQVTTPLTATDSSASNTPVTSSLSNTDTSITATPIAIIKKYPVNESSTNTSPEAIQSKNPSPSAPAKSTNPEIIPIVPVQTSIRKVSTNPVLLSVSPPPTSLSLSTSVPATAPSKVSPSTSNPPVSIPSQPNQHQKSLSSSSLISRLSFGLFNLKSPTSKNNLQPGSPLLFTSDSMAPPQHQPSVRNKTISGLGRRRKLNSTTKLGPVGYNYDSQVEPSQKSRSMVFSRPYSSTGALHKHSKTSSGLGSLMNSSTINPATISKPILPIKSTGLNDHVPETGNTEPAGPSNNLTGKVTRKRSRSLLSKKANLAKLGKESKRPVISAPIQGFVPSIVDYEEQLPEKLQQPSYPPPLPPPLQEQQEQMQRLQKQQQELEKQRKAKEELIAKTMLKAKEKQQEKQQLQEAQKQLEEEHRRFQLEQESLNQQQKSLLSYPVAPFRPLEPVEEVPSEASASPSVFVPTAQNSATSLSLPSARNSPRIPRSSPRLFKSPRLRNGQFSRSGECLLTRTNSVVSVVSTSSAVSGLSTMSGASSTFSSATGRSRRIHRPGRSHKHGSYRRVVLQSPAPSPNPNLYGVPENSSIGVSNGNQAVYNSDAAFCRSARSLANESNSSILRTAMVHSSTMRASVDMPGASHQNNLQYTELQYQRVPVAASISDPLLESSSSATSSSYQDENQAHQLAGQHPGLNIMHRAPGQDTNNLRNQMSNPDASLFPLSTLHPGPSRSDSFTSSSSDGTISDIHGYPASSMDHAISSSSLPGQNVSSLRTRSNSTVIIRPSGFNSSYNPDSQATKPSFPSSSSTQNIDLHRLPSIGGVMTANVKQYLSDDTVKYNGKNLHKRAPRSMSFTSASDYGMDHIEKSPEESSYTPGSVHPNSSVPITPVTPRGPYIPNAYSSNANTPMSVKTIVKGGSIKSNSNTNVGSIHDTPQRSLHGNNYHDDSGDWEDYPDENQRAFYSEAEATGNYFNQFYQKLNPQQQQTVLQKMNERDIHRLREMIVQEELKTQKMKKKMEKKRRKEEEQMKREELLMTSVNSGGNAAGSYHNIYISPSNEERAGMSHSDSQVNSGSRDVHRTSYTNSRSVLSDLTGTSTTLSTSTTGVTSGSGTNTNGTFQSNNPSSVNDTNVSTTASNSLFSLAPGTTVMTAAIPTTAPLNTKKSSSTSVADPGNNSSTFNDSSIPNVASSTEKPYNNDEPLQPIIPEKQADLVSANKPNDANHANSSLNSKNSSVAQNTSNGTRASSALRPFVSAPAASPIILDPFEMDMLSRKDKKKQKKQTKDLEMKQQQESFTKHWEERQAIFEARQREKQEKKQQEKAEKMKLKKKKVDGKDAEKNEKGRKRSKSFGFFFFGSHDNVNDTENQKQRFSKVEQKDNDATSTAETVKKTAVKQKESASVSKTVEEPKEVVREAETKAQIESAAAHTGQEVYKKEMAKQSKHSLLGTDLDNLQKQKRVDTNTLPDHNDMQEPFTQYQHPLVQPLQQLGEESDYHHHQYGGVNDTPMVPKLEPAAVITGAQDLTATHDLHETRDPISGLLSKEQNISDSGLKIHTPPITSSSPLTKFSKSVNPNHHSSSNLISLIIAADANASVDTGFTSNIIPSSLSRSGMPASSENKPKSIPQPVFEKFGDPNHQHPRDAGKYEQQASLAPPQPIISSASMTHSYSQPNSISLSSHLDSLPSALPHSFSYSDIQSSSGSLSAPSVQSLFAKDKNTHSMGLNDRGGQNGAYSASNKPSRLHNQIVANEAAKAKQINTGERNATQKKVKNEDKFSNQILDNDQLTDRKHKKDIQQELLSFNDRSRRYESSAVVEDEITNFLTSTKPSSRKKHHRHHRSKSSADVDLVDHLRRKPVVPEISNVNHPIDNIDNENDERYNDIEQESYLNHHQHHHTHKAKKSDGSTPEQAIEFSDDDDDRSKTPTQESVSKEEKKRRQKQERKKEKSQLRKRATRVRPEDSDNESLVEVGYDAYNDSNFVKPTEHSESKRKHRVSRHKRLSSGRYTERDLEEEDEVFKPVLVEALAPPSISTRRSEHRKSKSLSFALGAKLATDIKPEQRQFATSSSKGHKSGGEARKSSSGNHSYQRQHKKSTESGEYPQYGPEDIFNYSYGEYNEPVVPYYTISPRPFVYGYPADPSSTYRIHGPGQQRHRDMHTNRAVWGQPASLVYAAAPHMGPIHQRTDSASTTTTGVSTGRASMSSTMMTSPYDAGHKKSRSTGGNANNNHKKGNSSKMEYESSQQYSPPYLAYNNGLQTPMTTGPVPGTVRYPYLVAPRYPSLHSSPPVPGEYPGMMMPLGVAHPSIYPYGYERYKDADYDITPNVYAPQHRHGFGPGNNNVGKMNLLSPEAPGPFSELIEFLDQTKEKDARLGVQSDDHQSHFAMGPITASDEEAAAEVGGEGFGKGYEGAKGDMYILKLQRQVEATYQSLLRVKTRQDMELKEKELAQNQQQQQPAQEQPQSRSRSQYPIQQRPQHRREKSRDQHLLELARKEEKRLQREEEKKQRDKEQQDLGMLAIPTTHGIDNYDAADSSQLKEKEHIYRRFNPNSMLPGTTVNEPWFSRGEQYVRHRS